MNGLKLFASCKVALLFLLTTTSVAASPLIAKADAAPMPGTSAQLLQVFLALGLVVAIIYALAWFLKRFSQPNGLTANPIKIINSTSMGTREKLVLTEVNGQQLLLGVTAHSINTLHSFDNSLAEHSHTAHSNDEAVVDFKAKLAGLMAANKKPI